MLQLPCPVSPGPPDHIPTQIDQFISLVMLSVITVSSISFLLPRPLLCKLFRIAFPFMPERLEDFDEKK